MIVTKGVNESSFFYVVTMYHVDMKFQKRNAKFGEIQLDLVCFVKGS